MSRTRSRPRPVSSAPGGRPPRGLSAALLLLRLYAGAFFVDTALYKLVEPLRNGYSLGETVGAFRGEYVRMVTDAVNQPPEAFGVPLTAFSRFLEAVMLPAAGVFAPVILFGEALLGVSLVLGAGVRLSAALGFLMMLAFSLAKFIAPHGTPEHVYFLTAHSANWAMTLILLALCLSAAGRHLGLDAWSRRSGPRWLRWTS